MENKFKKILENTDELHIWEQLPNGCFIGTLSYSPKNVEILYTLLKSFEEQYGEEIDMNAAEEELRLYAERGKLFVYFDQFMRPVSMNGCIFNYDNDTINFIADHTPSSLYFYGLSTIPEYRGKGACRNLISYAIEFAKANGFDLVYARTDLINSNSEWLMKCAGMEVCLHGGLIIAEWVDVTDIKGDYRLHLWMPLKEGLSIAPKGNAFFATNDEQRSIVDVPDIDEWSRKLSINN